MGILIDTSVVIDYLRQRNKIDSWFYKLSLSSDSLSISIITHAELYSGKSVQESPKNRKILNDIISRLDVIPLDLSISAIGGSIKSKTSLDLLDCLIAATAIKNGHRLATLNAKHFAGIKKLEHLKVPQ